MNYQAVIQHLMDMEDVFFTAFTNPMTAQEKVETTFLGGANADYGQGIAI